MIKFIFFVGSICRILFPYSIKMKLLAASNLLRGVWIQQNFARYGTNLCIRSGFIFQGGKFIFIGKNVTIGKDVEITAIEKFGNICYSPEIVIGNNVSINSNCHITAINKILIGNYVRMGRRVLITDNAHGRSNLASMQQHPIDREVYSPGMVIIEDDVWIGNNVAILPNVKIGKGAIIGTNSVVTKDVPAYGIAVGSPAKIVKIVEY